MEIFTEWKLKKKRKENEPSSSFTESQLTSMSPPSHTKIMGTASPQQANVLTGAIVRVQRRTLPILLLNFLATISDFLTCL